MKTTSFVAAALLALGAQIPAVAQTVVVPDRLSLAEALRIADERSPSLVAARELVAAAEGGSISAGQRPNPALRVTSEGYPFSEVGRPPFFDDQELVVAFDQEVEMAGRRRLRTEAAQQSVEGARAALDDERRRLQLAVRRAYFAVVLAKTDGETAQTALAEIDQIIALNQKRFDQGEISGGELRRIQTERLRFADDVFGAELAAKNARSALLALLNVDRLDQVFEPVESLAPSSEGRPGEGPSEAAASVATSLDAAGLRARALAGRPDLMATRKDEARAETETRLQRALRTPNLTVEGGYKRDFGVGGLVLGVTVPLPLFGRNQGGIARAAAEHRLAATRVAAAETAVALEVQQAINAVEISRARVTYIERDHLDTARAARDIVRASYQAGAATLVDFLDAQRAFRATLQSYNRALYEHRVSLFELEAAVGSPAQPPAGSSNATGDELR